MASWMTVGGVAAGGRCASSVRSTIARRDFRYSSTVTGSSSGHRPALDSSSLRSESLWAGSSSPHAGRRPVLDCSFEGGCRSLLVRLRLVLVLVALERLRDRLAFRIGEDQL